MRGLQSFLIVVFCTLICFLNAGAQQQKTSPPKGQEPSSAARKPKTASKTGKVAEVKVLVRRVYTGVVAFDGAVFLIDLDVEKVAKHVTPQVLENLRLTSSNGIQVEMESRTAIAFPNGQKSAEKQGYDTQESGEKAAAGFDFLVGWTLDWRERDKFYILDKVNIDVNETWKVEKVSDPTVTKTWTLSYPLESPALAGSDAAKRIADAADEQTTTVIAPRRGPILREIRAFIDANRTKQNQ